MPELRTAYRWAVTALYFYGAVFVLLSVDLLVRVWQLRATFPRMADVAAIFFFELSRSTVTAGALALGLWLAWRRHHDPALRALAIAIGFGSIAFTKAAAFRGFPGFLQERAASWLLDHGAPQPVLSFVFGTPAWAVWFALAGLLLFAARFPVPASPELVERSGSSDRRGMLAGAGIAGANVGNVFRELTARLLALGMLRPVRLGITAALFAAIHHALPRNISLPLGTALAAVATGVVITLLRASHREGDALARDRIDALRMGATAAGLLIAAAALAAILPLNDFASAAFVALAPAPALYGVARAALTPECASFG